jgi:hypothetical protein
VSGLRRDWNAASVIYLVLAVVGLVGTWTFNITAFAENRDFLGEWFGSGPSVGSLGVDLAVVAVAAIVLMVAESRRLHMRGIVLYIVLVPLVALAFAFPLFLCARERHLTRQRGDTAQSPR